MTVVRERIHPLVYLLIALAVLATLIGSLTTAVNVGWVANPLHNEPVVEPVSAGICDPSTVKVYPAAVNGASVFVAAPGPNFVRVDIQDQRGHRRVQQQIPPGGKGAKISLFGEYMFRYKQVHFEQIDVTLRNGGTCTVAAGTLDELNQAHRWG